MSASEGDTRDELEATSGERWVTLKDASRQLRVSVSALRKWKRKDEVEWRMAPGPTGDRIEVELGSARARAAETIPHVSAEDDGQELDVDEEPAAAPPPAPSEPGRALIPVSELGGLFDRLAEAEARATRAELIEEHLRERLAELERERERMAEELEGERRPWWKRRES